MDRFYWIQALFILVSFITGTISYILNPTKDKLMVLPVYCLLSFLTTSLSTTNDFKYMSPVFINLFTIFEFFLFSTLIAIIIGLNKIKVIYIIMTLVYCIFALDALNRIQILIKYIRTDLIVMENVFLTVFCMLFFKNLLFMPYKGLKGDATFWIISGLTVYFCLTTPYHIMFNIINSRNKASYYTINWICNIVMHCLFIKGFLCRIKKT